MSSEQPFLHEDVAVLRAPVQAWSGTDGQIDAPAEGAARRVQGIYRGDVRLVSRAVVKVDGVAPEPVAHAVLGADEAVFTGLVRVPGAATPDVQLALERRRRVTDRGLQETLTIRSALTEPVRLRIELELGADLAELNAVRGGEPVPEIPLPVDDLRRGDTGLRWGDGGTSARLSTDHAVLAVDPDRPGLRATWSLDVQGAGEASVGWRLDSEDSGAGLVAPVPRPVIGLGRGGAGITQARRWLSRSAADLDALLLAPRERPDQAFLAAGAPWYFTLFGRDSIWAARLLLPVAPDLALSTLQVLAGRQGVRDDPETAEQPGKILHELRDRPVRLAGGGQGRSVTLPPVYYGSTDATLLWISLLAETWRAGADPAAIRALLPNLEAALGWLRDSADADGDGFVEYFDGTGRGLSNQGWKDSEDAIRFSDGRRAAGSIALVEVQGYAHRAALDGADLLAAFGRPGADEWRTWAAVLAARFRSAFWCSDALGPYPALALDKDKQRVDGVASNIGHLLGTGLLDAGETAAVAARLRHPSLFSGYGIRTLSADNGGYWPWSYHCGSVWAHDTAIILDGLRRAGRAEQAAEVATGLASAAEAFDGRLPELFAGDGEFPDRAPSAYPTSCRPQAWAAAAVVPAGLALGLL